MAWHTPRDWTGGEYVIETMMDEQIRDNMNILKTIFNDLGYPTKALVATLQSADLTKNANTTFDDLADMAFAIGANETWVFLAVSFVKSAGAPDAKWTVTAPTGATGRFGCTGAGGAPVSAGSESVFGNAVNVQIPSTAEQTVFVVGAVTAGVTAGTVQLQAAQDTSDASNTIFRLDSFLVAVRVLAP